MYKKSLIYSDFFYTWMQLPLLPINSGWFWCVVLTFNQYKLNNSSIAQAGLYCILLPFSFSSATATYPSPVAPVTVQTQTRSDQEFCLTMPLSVFSDTDEDFEAITDNFDFFGLTACFQVSIKNAITTRTNREQPTNQTTPLLREMDTIHHKEKLYYSLHLKSDDPKKIDRFLRRNAAVEVMSTSINSALKDTSVESKPPLPSLILVTREVYSPDRFSVECELLQRYSPSSKSKIAGTSLLQRLRACSQDSQGINFNMILHPTGTITETSISYDKTKTQDYHWKIPALTLEGSLFTGRDLISPPFHHQPRQGTDQGQLHLLMLRKDSPPPSSGQTTESFCGFYIFKEFNCESDENDNYDIHAAITLPTITLPASKQTSPVAAKPNLVTLFNKKTNSWIDPAVTSSFGLGNNFAIKTTRLLSEARISGRGENASKRLPNHITIYRSKRHIAPAGYQPPTLSDYYQVTISVTPAKPPPKIVRRVKQVFRNRSSNE